MGIARNSIIDFVQNYVDEIADTLKYDKTCMGKVKTVDTTTATVDVNGQTITCRIKDGITISTNDVVIIKIPNNNKNLKYIDGKLKK